MYDENTSLRFDLINMLAPIASASGAVSVENIINTAAKLERYIVTGINPLEPMVLGHNGIDPISSDTFEIEADDSIVVDENGILQQI